MNENVADPEGVTPSSSTTEKPPTETDFERSRIRNPSSRASSRHSEASNARNPSSRASSRHSDASNARSDNAAIAQQRESLDIMPSTEWPPQETPAGGELPAYEEPRKDKWASVNVSGGTVSSESSNSSISGHTGRPGPAILRMLQDARGPRRLKTPTPEGPRVAARHRKRNSDGISGGALEEGQEKKAKIESEESNQ